MLKLEGTDGRRYYSFELAPGKYLVGRKGECDICIPHNTVSRRHAELEVSDGIGEIYLIDLGSRNGTLVNNERITDRVRIVKGDRVDFGMTEFRLTELTDSGEAISSSSKVSVTENRIENSVLMPINEALRPLPKEATEMPYLISTIFELARMLVLNEPKKEMLGRALQLISRTIPCKRLAVLHVSDDYEDVFPEATLIAGEKGVSEFILSRTIINEVIKNRNAVLICNPAEDPRFAQQQSIIMSDMKSAMAVPLFDEGRVLGILYADTPDPGHSYDDEELRVMATFGNIIASRLANLALLHDREEKRVIDSELRRASEIQQNLLTAELPQIQGYEIYAFQEQSRSVGGDLYDMKILPDGRLLFMVADVSGKGLGAALLMSNILAAFRILYESESFDLIKAVKKVSHQICKYTDPGIFATMFIGVAEPGSNVINFVNAGHNPPYLVRQDGEIQQLDASGVMIGAFDFVEWTEQTVELHGGDQLFIYTDGVTEAEGPEEQYGEDRMRKTVVESRTKTPAELVEYVMDDIDRFTGDMPRSDDITIMVLKRTLNHV